MATVGPALGKLILRTGREGLAAQVGHDLVIEVTRWSGAIEVGEDPARGRVEIIAEIGSLRVLEGTGGALPLSDRDKREILRNARKILDSNRQPTARFVSNKITVGAIEGTLTLLGKERSFRLEVTQLADGRYRGVTGQVSRLRVARVGPR
jgi:polyisoprenoid-binding protein YceI